MILARASELPQPAPETHFLRLFGQSDRLITDSSTTDGSVPQALHLLNGATIESKVTAPDGTVAKLAGSSMTDEEVVKEIYLGTLCREPAAPSERAREKAPARRAELEDLMWVLLNSREFMFNH